MGGWEARVFVLRLRRVADQEDQLMFNHNARSACGQSGAPSRRQHALPERLEQLIPQRHHRLDDVRPPAGCEGV